MLARILSCVLLSFCRQILRYDCTFAATAGVTARIEGKQVKVATCIATMTGGVRAVTVQRLRMRWPQL